MKNMQKPNRFTKLKKLMVIGFSAVMIFALSACGSDEAQETGIKSISGFDTVDIYGEKVSADILKDYDLTLVNILSTSCNPCMEELPDLIDLSAEYKDKKLGFIGVCLDMNMEGGPDLEAAEALKGFFAGKDAPMKIIFPDEILSNEIVPNTEAIPFTFFVDKEGNVVGGSYMAAQSKEDWIKSIDKELK